MFAGYIKIPESSSKWVLTKKEKKLMDSTKWVVTEKVHGSCFAFVYDKNGSVKYAKRKEILSAGDDFFGYKQMLPGVIPKILKIVAYLKEKIKAWDQIIIYGELFGGIPPVQSGIFYSSDLHFYAFDISKISNGSEMYLDYGESILAFEHSEILYARPLFTGSFESAIAYKMGFQTTLPKILGITDIIENNKAEGIVIKPLKEILINSRDRMILKIKIPEFSEVKYNQSEKPKVKVGFNYFGYFRDEEIDNFLTENRMNNAVSKLGSRYRVSELCELLYHDVLSEFEENDLWRELESEERVEIKNILKKRIEGFVNKTLGKN
ncbi:MAG: 2'-5' RNA ligase [Hyperionvirus sp.]|uniref:2'-5' RNA ligase n=1 Tax=Hyperionvirus sp. TaxID=2487770 RepID=A0A3G5A6G2_9VIRU|nr:MAG: 2'-5' RNA ligase [Hyperionvirus sp.]